MELKQFIALIRRWFWLLILGLVLGIVAGIVSTWIMTPVYQAQTRVLVMRAPQDSTSPIAYLSDTQLTQTFGQFLVTKTVLDAVSNELGFRVDETQIQFTQVGQTQIIKLTVQDSNPERAATIANTVVKIAIQQYADVLAKQYTNSEGNILEESTSVTGQMNSLQTQITQASDAILQTQMAQNLTQINTLQSEISGLQRDIDALSPARTLDAKNQIAEKQARIDQIRPLMNAYQQVYIDLVVQRKPLDTGSVEEYNLSLLQDTLSQYQQYYISLNSSLATVRQRKLQSVSNVAQIDTAAVPRAPIRPQLLINTMLSGAAGLALALVAVLFINSLGESKAPSMPQKEDNQAPSKPKEKAPRGHASLEDNIAPGETLKEEIQPRSKPQKGAPRELDSLEDTQVPGGQQIEGNVAPIERRKGERRVHASLGDNVIPNERRKRERRTKVGGEKV
jgi:succinoglycan biosynthesis transport protein ExoP